MSELANRACEACRPGAPQATEAEIAEWLPHLPGWEIIEVDSVPQLTRLYKCKNFLAAMALAEQITEIAEAENHHPALLVEWGKLRVTWWTHKIKGLHQSDFIMAARTDGLVDYVK